MIRFSASGLDAKAAPTSSPASIKLESETNPDDALRQKDHESLVAPLAEDVWPRSTSREVGLTFSAGWLRSSRVTFGGLMPFSHPGTLAPKSAQESPRATKRNQ